MKRMLIIFNLFLMIPIMSSCHQTNPVANTASITTPLLETSDVDDTHPTTPPSVMPTLAEQPTISSEIRTPEATGTTVKTILGFSETTEPVPFNHSTLNKNIDQIIAQSGGRWHIVIKEIDGPTYYDLGTEQRIHIASVVKVPMALLFFAALEEKGIPEYELAEHIQSTGTGGRTFEQLLYAMLVNSEEDAFAILAEYVSTYINVPAQLHAWGLQNIDLEARKYTVLGVANLFERLYKGEFVSPTARKLILGYLKEYTPNDDSRIGLLRNYIPDSFQIYNKRGSLLTPYVVADSGILENSDGQDYIIAIFAYNSEPKTTYENLDQAIGDIALAFWESISGK